MSSRSNAFTQYPAVQYLCVLVAGVIADFLSVTVVLWLPIGSLFPASYDPTQPAAYWSSLFWSNLWGTGLFALINGLLLGGGFYLFGKLAERLGLNLAKRDLLVGAGWVAAISLVTLTVTVTSTGYASIDNPAATAIKWVVPFLIFPIGWWVVRRRQTKRS